MMLRIKQLAMSNKQLARVLITGSYLLVSMPRGGAKR